MNKPYQHDEQVLARRLGQRLRAAREAANLSLREIATAIGLRDHTVLIKYERGDTAPSSVRLIRLARALGCSPAALLAEHDTARPLIATLDSADEAYLAQVAFVLTSLDAPLPPPPDEEL